MAYEDFLKKLNITQIKFIIKQYKLNTKIVVGKKKREELIQELLKHTDLDKDAKNIILKEDEVLKIQKIPSYTKNTSFSELTTPVLLDKLKIYTSNPKYMSDTSTRELILQILSKRDTSKMKRDEKKDKYPKLSIEELRKRIKKAEEEEDAASKVAYNASLDIKLKKEKKKKI